MSYQGYMWLFTAFILLTISSCIESETWQFTVDEDDVICCLPDQYEATIYGFQGVASSNGGGHGFSNGTARLAYDYIHNKTYFFEVTSSLTTVLPFPVGLNITAIFDYNNDEKFIIFRDGTCHSEEIGYQLFKQCIPGNATLVGEGNFSGLALKHYMFTEDIYDTETQITVSVIMSEEKNNTECTPVRVTQSQIYPVTNQTNLDLSAGDVLEFNRGIRNDAIFKPPPACVDLERSKHARVDKKPPSLFHLWNIHQRRD